MSSHSNHITAAVRSVCPRAAIAIAACLLTASALAVPAPAAPRAPVPVDLCQRVSTRIPGVSKATCANSALTSSGVLSHNGIPILERDFSPVGQAAGVTPVLNQKRPVRVLLLGGIHGDELSASAIVFQWMQRIQTPMAQQFQWKVAPMVNPDGLLADKPKRVNAKGVDLNRNFPTPGWHQDAPRYWAKATGKDPRRFPGHAPLSEPESRWVSDAIERFHPDVIISVHAPFGVLDFDGPATPPRRFGRLVYNRVGVYPGSLGNYSGLYKHVPVITIELPNARAMPPDAEVQRIWQDMLSWIKRNAPQQAAVSGARLKDL